MMFVQNTPKKRRRDGAFESEMSVGIRGGRAWRGPRVLSAKMRFRE